MLAGERGDARPAALTLAQELEQGGRFTEALETLNRGPNAKEGRSADVLRAQLLERTGRHEQSRSLLAAILRSKDLLAADRSICELVFARLDWDSAKIDSAIVHLQRSIQYAKQAKDLRQICWSQLRLLGMLRDQSGVEATSALLAELRTNATQLGDARVLAALHIFLGQMEAQRGSFSSARRHTRSGLELLDRAPNLWLQATAENVNFGISVLLLDVDQGVELGKKALRLAEQSGAASTIGTSLGNLGNLCLALRRFDEAIDFHQRALAFVPAGGENWNGSVESLARVSLAQGHLDECERLLDEIDRAIGSDSDSRRYVYRYSRITRAKLLARLGHSAKALQTVESALRLAEESHDSLLTSLSLLTKAQILSDVGQTEATVPILWLLTNELPRLPAEFHSAYVRLVGRSLGETASSRDHFAIAERISAAIGGNQVDHAENPVSDAPSAERSSIRLATGERSALQSVGALLIHKGRPEILAREIVALLERTGVIKRATILRRLPSGTFVEVSSVGVENTLRNDHTSERTFEIGSIDGHRLKIVASCETDTESVATLNAITLLVTTLSDLESSRAECEERRALWPIEELPFESDGAILTGHMRELIGLARRIGPTNVTVLITGESGTGKEILARAIHAGSTRADKPLVPFNCAAIPRELLESQLFGHCRGAFTGADRDQPGIIRSVRDGTLFLDEIGEMGLELQPKLLRFLESGEISPLGEPRPLTVNVRVVAATNANLETLVRDGRFREDLYYRLNVVRLAIRPLRERRDEIPTLVNAFVARAANEFGKGHVTVAEETIEHLLVYPWPGNVRQLLNEVRRMVALAEPNATLAPTDISSQIRATLPAFPNQAVETQHIEVPLRSRLLPVLSSVEREMIKVALHDSGGKLDAAAKALGISRKGLYLKRQRLGL